jgi:flagellar motor switch protein FliG
MDNTNFSPEQIQQMILLLQKMLPQQEAVVEQEPKVSKPKVKKNSTSTKSKQNPIKTKKINMTSQHHENKFLEMSEMNMHKSDADIDKRLNKFPPTPRSRPFSLVSVRCRVCGKPEEVHPKLVLDSLDRYKCNDCSKAQG